jgi:hypothetical protein
MIGYYVHHVGQGHAHRAAAIAAHLSEPVTALSSLSRPSFWERDWVVLPDDDTAQPADPTANGALHWVPRRGDGLRDRMAVIATWIDAHRPSVLVSDLSVEVTVLARVMGIPVVMICLPGRRDDDPHQLAYRLADAILAPWPDLGPDMTTGLDPYRDKIHHVGGVSRFDGRSRRVPPKLAGRYVLALGGAGGHESAPDRPGPVPGWRWVRRDRHNWTADPWPDLCAADVVVTHCGLGAVSDVAAARKPAILLPEPRPHEEQYCTARALARRGLGVVLTSQPDDAEWPALLARAVDAMEVDANAWSAWSSGDGAARAARVIQDVAVS